MAMPNIPVFDIRPAVDLVLGPVVEVAGGTADQIFRQAKDATGRVALEVGIAGMNGAYPGMFSGIAKDNLRAIEDPFHALSVLLAVSGTAHERAALNTPPCATRLSSVPKTPSVSLAR